MSEEIIKGRRCFKLSEPVYVELCKEIDARRGFPSPTGDTLRSLPLPEDAPRSTDGDILVNVEVWRIEEGDETMLAEVISNGLVEEITEEEYFEYLVNEDT
jgi:hypothetical protein